MNRKQLGTLLVLLLVVGSLGLWGYLRNAASWKQGDGRGRVLGGFDLNAVDRVVIREGDRTLTLQRNDGLWSVEERAYLADFPRIRQAIQQLWGLKPTQHVRVGPSQLGRLGLLPPGEGEGVLVSLYAGGEKPVASLLLGKKHKQESALFPGDEGSAIGRYVMPYPAGETPQVALVPETFSDLVAEPREWLAKAFFDFGTLRSIALQGAQEGHRWKIDRNEQGQWQLEGLGEKEGMNAAVAASIQSFFANPRPVDVLEAGATVGEGASSVTLTNDDGWRYTLAFGKPEGGNIPVTVTLQAEMKLKRAPGPDESEEEKKRLDEAFAAKRQRLMGKLGGEKAREGRVFLVPETLFSGVNKPRSDFVEEQVAPATLPAPVPAETASAPPLR